MAIPPNVSHWTGVVVGCGIYLYLLCRAIDGIWNLEITGSVHEIIWNFALRRVLRWLVGFYIVVGAISAILMAVMVLVDPWKSLAWVVPGIIVLRLLCWIFWLLDEDADLYKIGRDSRAKQQGVHGWDRFALWCFGWGPYEGLLTKEEKRIFHGQSREQAQ